MYPNEINLINEKGIVAMSIDVLKEFTRHVKIEAVNEYIDANNTLIKPQAFSAKYDVSIATVMKYAHTYANELVHSNPTPKVFNLYEQKMCAKIQEIGKGKLRAIIYKK